MYSTSPKAFADLFNAKIPYAYRGITSYDVRLMTECNLIGRHKCYIRQDLETIRGTLQYEKLRQHRSAQQNKEKEPPRYKSCVQLLPLQAEGAASISSNDI